MPSCMMPNKTLATIGYVIDVPEKGSQQLFTLTLYSTARFSSVVSECVQPELVHGRNLYVN